MPPVRKTLSVPMAEPKENSSMSAIGPLVLMSGFLTKKTRSMHRWRQRWWQLMDNGLLLYFQSDKRVKILGEIDIGRTCYDVRYGAKNCASIFPRVAPSFCCFSFSVLKRTYYAYAPTPSEARKWTEAIRKVSNVLNRRIVAGVDRRKAPEPPGLSRPPSCPPNFRISMTPCNLEKNYSRSLSTSVEDVYRIKLKDDARVLPTPQVTPTRMIMASSVPDYLDDIGIVSPPSSRLWLDGSPLEDQSYSILLPKTRILSDSLETSSTFSPMASVLPLFVSNSNKPSNVTSTVHHRSPVSPSRRRIKRRHSLPRSFEREFGLLEGREERVNHRLKSVDLPPRPASMSSTFSKTCHSNTPLPQPKPRHQKLSSAVQVMPVSNKELLHRTLSRSTDSLVMSSTRSTENRLQSASVGGSTGQKRPIPKPRKSKLSTISLPDPVPVKKVSFSNTSQIINPSTEGNTDLKVSNPVVDGSDLPPPRPRKDSGPPNFKPPPPPLSEKGESLDSNTEACNF